MRDRVRDKVTETNVVAEAKANPNNQSKSKSDSRNELNRHECGSRNEGEDNNQSKGKRDNRNELNQQTTKFFEIYLVTDGVRVGRRG